MTVTEVLRAGVSSITIANRVLTMCRYQQPEGVMRQRDPCRAWADDDR
jgi:hypothetical protein